LEEGDSRKNPGLWEVVSRFLSGKRRITGKDIREFMNAGEEEGIINEEENEMIRSIFALRGTVVREIMVPRTEMVCVPSDATVREALDATIGCGHSRIPVFEGTIDNIVGILYAKDLLKHWGTEESAILIRRIMRAPFFIPEAKNLEALLQEFKKKRVHIAIVMDEYGGTAGLVTIEDLLEQIVGDIQDEYDLEEEWLLEEPDGAVKVDARLPIEDMEQRFGIEVEREKFDTVGGLVFHLTGRIPAAGEEITCGDIRMTVLDADERRIGKMRIRRIAPATGEAEK
jgi:CBS domain containing-hemolysin-like protein